MPPNEEQYDAQRKPALASPGPFEDSPRIEGRQINHHSVDPLKDVTQNTAIRCLFSQESSILKKIPMAQRVRILLLIPHLGGGGAERVTALLARGLSREKYDLHLGLITQSAVAGVKSEPALPPWVTVHELSASRVREASFPLLRLVHRLEPDVILSGMAHLNFLVLLLRPLFPSSTRVLVRQNGTVSSVLAHDGVPPYTRLLYRLLYRHADRVICQSHAMADDLAAALELRAERIAVLPNPVDTACEFSMKCGRQQPSRLVGMAPDRICWPWAGSRTRKDLTCCYRRSPWCATGFRTPISSSPGPEPKTRSSKPRRVPSGWSRQSALPVTSTGPMPSFTALRSLCFPRVTKACPTLYSRPPPRGCPLSPCPPLEVSSICSAIALAPGSHRKSPPPPLPILSSRPSRFCTPSSSKCGPIPLTPSPQFNLELGLPPASPPQKSSGAPSMRRFSVAWVGYDEAMPGAPSFPRPLRKGWDR